jgi:hypothetical protein
MDITFSEWLKNLCEGVEVHVEIPENQQKRYPRDLSELASLAVYELRNHHNFGIEQIAPDGDDYFKTEGILNVYVEARMGGSQLPEEKQTAVLRELKSLFEKFNVLVTNITPNTYKDYNIAHPRKEYRRNFNYKASEIDLNKTRVYRIHVKIDPKRIKEANVPPDVDMGFAVAKIVFEDIFGLGDGGADPTDTIMRQFSTGETPERWQNSEWEGYQFTADQILQTYERLKNDLNMWAGLSTQKGWSLQRGDNDPDEPWKKYKGPEIIRSGIDKERILRNVEAVVALARWGKQHGYNKMYAV